MTIGERLQQLRKEKQMSQEELGNLLLVSRQTISLWENNQTVPTVDNLIRLKEIFGVTIDSIITGETTKSSEDVCCNTEKFTSDDTDIPTERYSYYIDKKELKYFYRITTGSLLKPLTVLIVSLLFSIVVTVTDTSAEQNSFFVFFLVLIFFCVFLIRYICALLAVRKNYETVCCRQYTYEIFNNRIFARVANDGEEIKTQMVYFKDFTNCWETPFCYFLESKKDKILLIIKKSSLKDSSLLNHFCQSLKTQKTDLSSKKIVYLKTLGTVSFISCFAAFFLGLIVVSGASLQDSEDVNVFMKSLIVFHYLLPVPILSIISGILLNKNKIQNKKNIIVGVIIGLMFLAYGFMPTVFEDMNSNMDFLETQLGFEFPQTISMEHQVSTDFVGGTQSITTMSFAESVANEFEDFMKEDNRWIDSDKTDFTEFAPEALSGFVTDYFLFYLPETGEFGKIPENAGRYPFVYIAYNADLNVAYIYEYQYTEK